jgi:twitching motility protein PilT
MSILEALVTKAKEQGASDLHLEGGLPAAFRIQGELRMAGDPVPAAALSAAARELLEGEDWDRFLQDGAADMSKSVSGVRCRINVLHSARGVGMAIRFLSSFQATLTSLNLHPDLKKLVASKHGLIMVSGPTGCGKSSTMAALLQEVNLNETRHIVTIESPIEYILTPRRSLIRQRQVGRDTPTFGHALIDALREDPDVLMVGEMRDPETMRMTLNAAETGHLVITTVHSSSCAEAVGRVVGAFPAEIQPSIAAQLADCLAGVVCQRLRYRPDLRMRIPECEIMLPSSGVRGIIRASQFSRLGTALESGGQEGQWTFDRYRTWLDGRRDWVTPSQHAAEVASELPRPEPIRPAVSVPRPAAAQPTRPMAPAARPTTQQARPATRKDAPPSPNEDGVLVIDDAEDPAAILERMGRR